MRVLVVGGGYAGLSCLIALSELLPDSRRTLVDPALHHLKTTRLHEALRRPLDELRVPFARLGQRFGFRHVRARPSMTNRTLQQADDTGRLVAAGLDEPFDVLVIAVGVRSRPRPQHADCTGLAQLRQRDGRKLVRRIAAGAGSARQRVSVVGGGATGLQYLFELRDALRREGARTPITLIDSGDRLLPDQPPAFDRYVRRRMDQSGVNCLGGYLMESAGPGHLVLSDSRGGRRELPSAFSLILTGAAANATVFDADPHGRVFIDDAHLQRIFAAGDCSRYQGHGLNTRSAQAAVRKGRLVAENVRRLACGRPPATYDARELGFFLSMGLLDGIGWVGDRRAVVTGAPAFAVREAIETRYELFVKGVDTFQLL